MKDKTALEASSDGQNEVQGRSTGLPPFMLDLQYIEVSQPQCTHGPSASTSRQYHEDYRAKDANLTIATSDGQFFHVHSFILSLASGFFRTMLTLGDISGDELIEVPEDGDIWSDLLDIIYPDKVPRFTSGLDFADFKELCFAAEKYEIPSVLYHLQFYLHSERFYPPVSTYVLACRFSWKREAKLASTRSLNLDLQTPAVKNQLKEATAEDALRLMDLHASRRNDMIKATQRSGTGENMGPIWQSVVKYHTDFSPRGLKHMFFSIYALWDAFRLRVVSSMQKDPSGSLLLDAIDDDLALWTQKCDSCNKCVVDRSLFCAAVKDALERLPNAVTF